MHMHTHNTDVEVYREKAINLGVTVIDEDFAGTFQENDASDGGFSASGAPDSLSGDATGKPRLHVLHEVRRLQVDRRWGRHGGGGDDEPRGSDRSRPQRRLRLGTRESEGLVGDL